MIWMPELEFAKRPYGYQVAVPVSDERAFRYSFSGSSNNVFADETASMNSENNSDCELISSFE